MGKLITLIYFYLISVIGLILLIIGLYNTISYVVNTTQYDKYPLRYAGNESCDYLANTSAPMKPIMGSADENASGDAQMIEKQRIECEKRVERERKQTQVDDIKNSIYFSLIGMLLLAIHLPIALRKSAEEKK